MPGVVHELLDLLLSHGENRSNYYYFAIGPLDLAIQLERS